MKVKYVDAAKLRNTLDTDFSGYGTSEYYLYIPKGEVWLDRKLKGEKSHYLKLIKLEKMMRGWPFSAIRTAAKKLFTTPLGNKKLIKKASRLRGYDLKYVDGAVVRKTFDPYFELGGHHLVYDYIPKNQIWVDAKTDPGDWKYTVIHEIDEHQRMKKGASYDEAHDFALATERAARRKDGAKFFR